MAELDRVLELLAREFPWTEADARAWWEANPQVRAEASALR
jgi:hypothetical protein